MLDYFKDLNGLQTGYLCIALIGTILFILQSLLTFLDLGDHFELDSNFDGEVEFDFLHGLGLPLHLFSVRGIIGFIVLLGWSGLMFSKAGVNTILTVFLSILCGFIMMIAISLVYYFTNKLGESGNVDIKIAVGKQCEVYIPIPGFNSGTGKVSIILNDSLKELDAITFDEDIKSGEIVKVVNILNDKLVVEKINK